MSFSSDAKAELCRIKTDSLCCAVAECYGVLLYCNTFNANEIKIITASPELAARLPRLFKKAFGVSFDVLPPDTAAGKRTLIINDKSKISRIAGTFGIDISRSLSLHVNFPVLENDCCKTAFLRGAFLAGGSVTDPEKHFHLELATNHRSVSGETCAIMLEAGFSPREAQRKNSSLLYFKQADLISDFLTSIGASVVAMNVITAKVEREMNNTITRRVNCDSANADKIVSAAQEQVDAIHRYAARYGLDSLPEELKSAAFLRITNPEASLADLAGLSVPRVSKSCLSHRLKRIGELADREVKE